MPGERADAWIEEDRAKVIDLVNGALYRLFLIKLAQDHYIWYQCQNHISLDAYGGALFNQRTAEVYQALLDGRHPGIRPLAALRELVDEEASYRNSSDHEEDRRYWLQRLNGVGTPPSLSLGPRRGEDHNIVHSGRITVERAAWHVRA